MRITIVIDCDQQTATPASDAIVLPTEGRSTLTTALTAAPIATVDAGMAAPVAEGAVDEGAPVVALQPPVAGTGAAQSAGAAPNLEMPSL